MIQGVRRSERIAKEVPRVLIGSDTESKVFSEETKTVVLSCHGAGIVSRHKLAAEYEIIIRTREANKEAIAQVVGQIGFDKGDYSWGIDFVELNIHFWNTQLPPPTPADVAILRTAPRATPVVNTPSSITQKRPLTSMPSTTASCASAIPAASEPSGKSPATRILPPIPRPRRSPHRGGNIRPLTFL